MKRQSILRKAIPMDCHVPGELQAMLPDFKDMVNRLISWGLFERVRDPREMRDHNYEWFREEYGGRYAIHYLHSASSVACDLLSSWDKQGGNTSSRPYVRRPFARLDQMLVKVERKDRDGVRIRITLAPRQYSYVEAPVHHRFWSEYLGHRLGELTVVPDGVKLLVQVPNERRDTDRIAAVDLNFHNALAATSDGKMIEMDLKPIMAIQERMREKRKRVQRALPRNLEKQQKVLGRAKDRERHRVEDLLHEAARDFVALVEDRAVAFEDLRSLSPEDAQGRRFRERLSAWARGRFQDICEARSGFRPRRRNYAGYTSTYCPFCNSKVSHPKWKISRCSGCRADYDRNRLAAVANLVRQVGPPHRKGEPWTMVHEVLPPKVSRALRRQSLLTILPSATEAGQTDAAPTSPVGLWEVPVRPLFEPGGPFIPNVATPRPDGGATSATQQPCWATARLENRDEPMTDHVLNTEPGGTSQVPMVSTTDVLYLAPSLRWAKKDKSTGPSSPS